MRISRDSAGAIFVYIDALDVNGTIRTGTAPFGPIYSGASQTGPHATTKYAYADTLILFTVKRLCTGATGSVATLCTSVQHHLNTRRAVYPLNRWSDPATGRNPGYPYRCINGTYSDHKYNCTSPAPVSFAAPTAFA